MLEKSLEICQEHKYSWALVFISVLSLIVIATFYSSNILDFFRSGLHFVEIDRIENNIAGFEDAGKKEIIRVGGSDSVYPLFNVLAREFERKNPACKVALLPAGHTISGVVGLVNGEYDIGLTSRQLKPAEEAQNITMIPFARDGLAFITHPWVQIKNLTSSQICDIYSGKIYNWRQVGGRDAAIVVIDRPEYTSAKIQLRKNLFPKDLKITPSAIEIEKPGQVTESMEYMENSIGYTSFGELAMSSLNFNVIKVNNIYPSTDNVQKNRYPFYRTYGLIVGPNPKKEVMHFFDFIFGEDGQKLIEENGSSFIVMKLVFATVPEQNILKQENRYRPLVEYLEKKLAMKFKIQLRHLPGYEDIVNEFVTGNVNVAFFGSLTYGIVQAKVGALPVARPEKNGISSYCGVILTRADSGIRSWRDLKGKSFAMIKATTAADLFPRLFLKRQGVGRAEDYLGRIRFVGSHDAAVEMVLNKTVDAGAAKDLIFEKLAAENPRIKQELVVIARSDPVPDNALIIRRKLNIMCYHCHLGDDAYPPKSIKVKLCDYFTQQLRKSLLNLDKTPEGRQVLRNLGADRFVSTSDEDYKNLYKMVRELGVNLAEYPLP